MKVIGLTGNIGTGKSTASAVIKSLNIKLIDCDVVSRELASEKKVLDLLEETFGKEIINSKGSLDRKKLGSIAFKNKENLSKLNNIMYPLIKNKVKCYIKEFKKTEKLCIVDGAILIEANFKDIVEDIILIKSNEKDQLERVKKRDGHNYDYTKRIIDAQMPLSEKEKHCKYIINNDQDIEYLKKEVTKLMRALLESEE